VDRATLHVGLIFAPAGDDTTEAAVTLRGAEAHFSTNSAAATASFAICRHEGDGILAVGGSLDRWCTEVVPLDGETPFDYSPHSGEYLIMTIEPTRAGSARVDSVTIDYALDGSHLWQRGEQTVLVDATAQAR
jgi:hypothetical protein